MCKSINAMCVYPHIHLALVEKTPQMGGVIPPQDEAYPPQGEAIDYL